MAGGYDHRKHPAECWVRRFFYLAGITLLGYVSFALADAHVYQAYENWRLNQTISGRSSSKPSAQSQVQPTLLMAVSNEPRKTVTSGAMLGRLEIKRIGVSVIIAEGVDGKTLRRAVGHIPGTALPGEPGNIGIAGHRDTYFRALSEVRENDEITLTTADGAYSYRVDSVKIVAPDDTGVLNDSGLPVLTLVTCYPFYFVGPAPKRFIVRAHRS